MKPYKTIQNELVEVIGECVCNNIIAEVKWVKFYSVITDEVTDTADKEELSLSLHFVDDGTVKEVFCWFRGGWEDNWSSVDSDYPSLTINAWSLPNRHQRTVLWWCIQYVRSGIRMQVHCSARGPTPLCSPQFGSSLSLQDPILEECWVVRNYSAKRQRVLDKAIESSPREQKPGSWNMLVGYSGLTELIRV